MIIHRAFIVTHFLFLLSCARLLAAQPDYAIAPVPPRFERDADTIFLADFTKDGTSTNEASLNPQAWTIELLLHVRANPDASQVQTLVQWGEPENYNMEIRFAHNVGLLMFGRERVAGRKHRFSFNTGAAAFGERKSGPGQWLYCTVGVDFRSGRTAVVIRDEKGDLASRRHEAFRVEEMPADKRAAWEEMATSLTNHPTAKLKFGGEAAEIVEVRISNRFREDLLPHPKPISETGTVIPADKIDPKRVQSRTIERRVGYIGYNNFVTQPTRETFIPLAVGSEPIQLTLKNLGIGVYALHVYGTIDPQGRDKLERVWRPCPMAFELRDASGRLIEQGRRLLRQGFAPKRMQAFSFHVNEPGDYTATFRLTDRAQETAQILWITFEDHLSGLPDEAIKKAQNLDAGKTGQLKELNDERKKRDDLIWMSLPPLNLQLQVLGQVKEFRQPPASVKLPQWNFAANGKWTTNGFKLVGRYARPDTTFAPLDLINTETGEVFPHDKVVASEPWPGEWSDDGTGIFFSKQKFPELPSDIYNTPRAELLGRRIAGYTGMLGMWDGKGSSLAKVYFEKGDPQAGHDAALALVRLAYEWPALDASIQEARYATHSPDLEFNFGDERLGKRAGKHLGDAWSATSAVEAMQSYDQLFPYIQNNQVFADAVHRFIPWIKTPQDVVRFLDRWLVWASVRDFRRVQLRHAPIEEVAAQVLGPHPKTVELYDLTRQKLTIYPYEGTYQDLYATALSRSGCYHIGSFMVYAFGDAAETISRAHALMRAKQQGVKLPMDLSDLDRYPKVRSACSFLIEMWPAGGFPFMVGDASGGTHAGNLVANRLAQVPNTIRNAFDLTGDPRHAWILQNMLGITNDAVAKAAVTVRNPILHAPSRVVADWGAILEFGVDETNLTKKTAATLRLGSGQGHTHSDYLDVNFFAMGLPMAVDLACRNEGNNWSRPGAAWAFLHNHAIAHETENPNGAGSQAGEPWLRAFAPPLVRGSYVNKKGDVRLDRDAIMMQVGDSDVYYAFDVQRLRGDKLHTWCFHGCESDDIALNVPMEAKTVRWIDRLLEGTHKIGKANDTLQATWTMTREGREFKHNFMGGGVIKTAACEPTVLGKSYDSNLPPVRVRATLLGHGGDQVLQGNPYSQAYSYCFPFLWVQKLAGDGESVYPAIYEWYRGETSVVAKVELVSKAPLTVRVTTTTGQIDTFVAIPTSFTVVSRDARGVRFAKLSGGDTLNDGDLSIKADRAAYSTTITDIDYLKRTIRVKDALPVNPRVSIGNDGHRTYLELKGAGTEFTYEGDLLVQQGTITQLKIVDDDHILIESEPTLFHSGDGNLKPEGYTVANEDLGWQFRGGKVIRRPAGAKLTEQAFADINGDGRAQMKTYEIGIGDTVEVLADVTLRREGDRYEIKSNVSGEIKLGKRSSQFNARDIPQEIRK